MAYAPDRLSCNQQAERRRRCREQRRRVLFADVGDQVTELVHLEDHAAQAVVADALYRCQRHADIIRNLWAKLPRSDALAQPSRDWRKDVATVEGLAYRLEKIALSRDVADAEFRLSCFHQREYAVVRRHEEVVIGLDDDRASPAAHTGVNHHDMYGVRRKETIRLRNRPHAIQDVVGRHRMTDINDGGLRMDAEHHAVHDAYKGIVEAKVGCEGDNRVLGHALAK